MNSNPQQHAVIILAAGASRRLGTPKQLLMIDNETLLNRALRIAASTHPAQTLLVLGHNADEIFASVNHKNVERVDCNDWQSGMSASLRAGIRNVNAEYHGALILLCDQPALSASHLMSMINSWHKQPDRAVASAYGNTVGVPALLPRDWFTRVGGLESEQGARELLRNDATVIRIDAPELVHDVDLPQDLPPDFA